MTWLIIALILWFGGKLLLKATGADKPYFLCRKCVRITHGSSSCKYCADAVSLVEQDDHLHVRLDFEFSGERIKIVQTLEMLSAELKCIADASELPRPAPVRAVATPDVRQALLPLIAQLLGPAGYRFRAGAATVRAIKLGDGIPPNVLRCVSVSLGADRRCRTSVCGGQYSAEPIRDRQGFSWCSSVNPWAACRMAGVIGGRCRRGQGTGVPWSSGRIVRRQRVLSRIKRRS